MEISNTLSSQESQQEFFVKYGYAGPFSATDVNHSAEDLYQKLDSSRKFFKGFPYKFLNDGLFSRQHHIFSRLAYSLSTSPSIAEDISHLLGPDILLWVSHLYPRQPGDSGQSWHRDETCYRFDGVHVSVAISDMNLSNGCLQVIPKTHHYQISNSELEQIAKREGINLYDGKSVASLADRLYPENAPHQVVAIEMKAGQYFFTKGGLWHGVVPNQTNEYRLGFFARYMRTDVNSSLPCILIQGHDDDQKNSLYQPPHKTLQNNLLLNGIVNMMLSAKNLTLCYENISNQLKINQKS